MRNLLMISCFAMLAACASKSVGPDSERFPAGDEKGTGTIGSSEEPQFSFSSYKLPITRNNVEARRLAHTGWAGEWPKPIIDVNGKDPKGTTKVSGYSSLRVLGARQECTIKNGVYHPWSDTTNSVEDYWSLDETSDYQITRNIKLPNEIFADTKLPKKTKFVPKGSQIINEYYDAEGYCSATLKIGKVLRELFYPCEAISKNNSLFKPVEVRGAPPKPADPEKRFGEQWVAVRCEEKDNGVKRRIFIQDTDLMSQPGVQYGSRCGYGKVAPKDACPPGGDND